MWLEFPASPRRAVSWWGHIRRRWHRHTGAPRLVVAAVCTSCCARTRTGGSSSLEWRGAGGHCCWKRLPCDWGRHRRRECRHISQIGSRAEASRPAVCHRGRLPSGAQHAAGLWFDAEIAHPALDAGTCKASTGEWRTLDYFLVSKCLMSRISSCEVVLDAKLRPHRPVALNLRQRAATTDPRAGWASPVSTRASGWATIGSSTVHSRARLC